MMAATRPVNFKKVFINRAVAFCLFQGLLQLIAALIGLRLIHGQINISSIRLYDEKFIWIETIANLTYRTYFRNNCTVGKHENNWSCRAPAATRTYFWILFYTIICTIWVLCSLLLLGSHYLIFLKHKIKFANSTLQKDTNAYSFIVAIFDHESKKLSIFDQLFRYWWMVVTTFVLFTDAFASAQYLLDLEHMTDEYEYYKFIGLTPNDTIPLPPCIKTAYIYIPSILMALFFSKGIIGWILTVILLLSVAKHFQKPKLQQEIENLEENQNNNEGSSISNEDIATAALSTTTLGELSISNGAEQNYVPWMNILYLPSIYEGNDPDKIPEYYEEHHYEHVTGPYDVPGGITIEIPPKIKNDPKITDDAADNNDNNVDPKLMKIDVGNISIQVNQRNFRGNLSSPSQNLNVLKIPRVSGPCSKTNCNIHRAFSFTSAQEENPNTET